MEFWGVEVKPGQSLKVEPDEDQVIHVSQASLGEFKKGKGVDSVPLYVKFGDQKLVLGTLSSEKFPQISFDLVFEKEFELSHNWTGGSVYFLGYKSVLGDEDEEHSDFDSDEDVPMHFAANGNAELAPVPSVKAKGPKKSEDSEEDDSDSEDASDGSGDDDEVMSGDSDEDDDESEEDEETPKKPEVSKKRANEAAAKPRDNKKAKLATPSKIDVKKEVHTATPHPKKQGKSPAGNKTQSPKSAGSVSCKSCSKTFNSEVGLQSHAKAKHSAGK